MRTHARLVQVAVALFALGAARPLSRAWSSRPLGLIRPAPQSASASQRSRAQDGVSQTSNAVVDTRTYQDLRWRSVGPHRGGRSTAVAGVRRQPGVFYLGASGGGVWKTENYGITWTPVTDGQIATGSI